MKAKRTLLWTLLCVLPLVGALAAPARSESGPDYARNGIYLGAGAAFAWDNFDVPSFLSFDPADGFDAWGGYRFMERFAGELQIEYLNGFGIGPFNGQALTFTGNLKLYLLTGRIQPFLLTGIGLGWEELAGFGATGFAARFGGGLDYYLNESWSLQVSSSYVLQTGDLNGGDYVSLVTGFQYHF